MSSSSTGPQSVCDSALPPLHSSASRGPIAPARAMAAWFSGLLTARKHSAVVASTCARGLPSRIIATRGPIAPS
eukprot:scaffold44811_cov60-Phaeocystis_antarctica.AAC.2